jgi:3-hydroxyacyl-CoA dehydrogenase
VGLGKSIRLILLITDTTSYIAEGWREKAAKEPGIISEDLIQPSPLLEQMVKDGNFGRKSGKGFHDVSDYSTSLSVLAKCLCATRPDG